jgi:hypothetical protein
VCRGSGRQGIEGQSPRFAVHVVRIDANTGGQEHHECPKSLLSPDHGVGGIHLGVLLSRLEIYGCF